MIPLGYYIAVHPTKRENVTAGGLIIPDAAVDRHRARVGVAVAVGKDSGVQQGQVVYFKPNAGIPVLVGDKECILLSTDPDREQVLAVVNPS